MTYPKTAIPVWVNLFLFEKIPEHKILTQNQIFKILQMMKLIYRRINLVLILNMINFQMILFIHILHNTLIHHYLRCQSSDQMELN